MSTQIFINLLTLLDLFFLKLEIVWVLKPTLPLPLPLL